MSVCDDATDVTQASQLDLTPPTYVFERTHARYVSPEDLGEFKEDITKLIQALGESQKKEVQSILPTLQIIQNSNLNIENSISFLSAQNEELFRKIEQLEKKAKEDKDYIIILEDKLENLQMGCRKSNLEIKNVPRRNNESKEDLVNMALCLSSTIGGQLSKNDIKDIYRVRGKAESNNPPIVLETSSTLLKADILKLCKAYNTTTKGKLCAKHLGARYTNDDIPIYVSEQLTAKGSRLYFRARDLAKSKQYKFCWTSYGRVYVRKTENSPIITIKTELQVDELLNKN